MTTPSELASAAQGSWLRFLETYQVLRPPLYRYCRYLTRSPWDAEDLAQDALARAFVTLARMHGQEPAHPRAWLFRIASNLWIDQLRRRREVPADTPERTETPAVEPRAPREAAGTLLVSLSPQERAAVVLKDVFDFSLEEVAESLNTTVGAVKTALGWTDVRHVDIVQLRPPEALSGDAFTALFHQEMREDYLARGSASATAALSERGWL